MTFLSDGSGNPLSDIERDDTLPAPVGEIAVAVEYPNDPNEPKFRAFVTVNLLEESPATAIELVMWALSGLWQHTFAESIAPAVGVWRVAELPPVAVDTTRHIRMAYKNAAGALGELSNFVTVIQPADDTVEPGGFAFTSPPSMILDPVNGLRVGATLGADAGAVTGATGDPVPTLWLTADATPPAPGAASHGTQVTPFVFQPPAASGGSLLLAGDAGKFPWIRSAATDGLTTIYDWSAPDGAIAAAPSATVDLVAADVELLPMVDIGGGIFPLMFRVNSAKCPAADYDGYAAATGLKIRVAFVRTTTDLATMLANWMPLVPGDYVGLDAPLTTEIDPGYTGVGGAVWRLDERPDQTAANVGGFWESSWGLKRGRSYDETDPRRVVRLWQVSTDGGANWGNVGAFSIQADMPATGAIVVDVSTTAQLSTALAAATSTRTIRLAGGNYSALAIADRNFAGFTVTIESASPSSPAVFNTDDAITVTDSDGITFKGLHFVRNVNNSSTAIDMLRCSRVIVRDCNIQGHKIQVHCRHSDNVQILFNTQRGAYMDFYRLFWRNNNITLRGNDCRDHTPGDIGGEHRDFVQVATNTAQQGADGFYGLSNVTIEQNIFINDTIQHDGDSVYVQSVFVFSERLRDDSTDNFADSSHRNITVRDNYIRGSQVNGIAFSSVDVGTITRNTLRDSAAFPVVSGRRPTVNLYRLIDGDGSSRNRDLTITNNVTPVAFATTDYPSTVAAPLVDGTYTNSGNVVSTTAWPTGWPWGTSLPPAGQYGDVAPPPPGPAAYWKPIERTTGAKNTDPKNYGFGFQYERCMMPCEDEPQYIVTGGDMNGVHLSDTMGRTWFHPASKGLRAPGFNSVFIDPRDHRYLLALGNWVWWGGEAGSEVGRTGIWRSTDFGENWTLAKQLNNSSAEGFNQSLFAYDPATRAGAVGSRTIYLMNRNRLNGKGAGRDAPVATELWRSTNGGAAWTQVGSDYSVSKFGKCYQMIHLPDNCLLLACETGLWKSNTAKTTWARVPDVPATRVPSVSANAAGTKLHCCVRATGSSTTNNGIWTSEDSGASWAKEYSALPVKRMAVNWSTTPETVFVQLNQGDPGMVTSKNGSAGPWVTHGLVPPAVGWDPKDTYHRGLSKNTSSDGFEGVICPNAPGVCVVNGVGRMFRTEDYGANFVDTTWGFTGINSAATGSPLIDVNPSNPNEKVIAIQDANCIYTSDNWGSVYYRAIPKASMAAALGADSIGSSYLFGWLRSGRWIVGFGVVAQGVCASDDKGLTWIPLTAWGVSSSNSMVCKHPTSSPEAIAIGDKISRNNGNSIAATFNGRAQGVDATGTLYAVIGNVKIVRSANWATAATPTWTDFYEGPNFVHYGVSNATMRVSNAEANTVWTKGASHDLIRVRNSGTTLGSAVVTSFPLRYQAGGWVVADFDIADIQPDPRDRDIVYVTAFAAGASVVWRLNAATGAWTDITYNAPRWQDLSIWVDPSTGDPIIGGAVGSWMLQAPSTYQAANAGAAASRWGTLAVPVKVPAPV